MSLISSEEGKQLVASLFGEIKLDIEAGVENLILKLGMQLLICKWLS